MFGIVWSMTDTPSPTVMLLARSLALWMRLVAERLPLFRWSEDLLRQVAIEALAIYDERTKEDEHL